MKRRTLLTAVPAMAASAGCVVQDRSTALSESQVAPTAKAVVGFEYHAADRTVTIVLNRATGFERGVVRRVFVTGTAGERVEWVNVDSPETARARLPLDDGDRLTVEAVAGDDLRVAVTMAHGDRSSVVGTFAVPDGPATTHSDGQSG